MRNNMKKFLFFALEILGIIGHKLGIRTPETWRADGLGPNLELPSGTPFNYTPSYIVLPYFGD